MQFFKISLASFTMHNKQHRTEIKVFKNQERPACISGGIPVY